jgi:hypothetical protein
MDLARNLKKILLSLANRISVETSYPYTERKEKQTTKKPGNSSFRESFPNLLTIKPQHTIMETSSEDTTEKTTMKKMETEDIISHIRDWSIDKVKEVSEKSVSDANAIYREFEEWIEIEKDFEVISLEPDS